MALPTESALHRVTMNLTQRDVANTEKVRQKFHARSNAQAVSAAVTVTASLAELLENGGELLVRNKDGETQRIVIPGLTSP